MLPVRPRLGAGAAAGTAGPVHAQRSQKACATEPAQQLPSHTGPIGEQVRRRESLLQVLGVSVASLLAACTPAEARQDAGDGSTPGLAAPENDAPKFSKLANGVKIQQLTEGSGPQAQAGDRVVFDYVLRRSNGYFIYGTVEGVSFQPRDLPIGPVNFQLGQGKLIDGLDTALQGTMPGAKLRILVPSNVGYLSEALEPSPPGFAAKRQLINHKNEPFLFEVQVRKVIKG